LFSPKEEGEKEEKTPKRSKASPEGSFSSLGRNKKIAALNVGAF